MRCLAALFCSNLLLTAFAGVILDDSIQDVYYRGTAETIGATSHTLNADTYAGASWDTPIYIRMGFTRNTVLTTTRVDLTSNDEELGQPINLALTLNAGYPAYRLVADAHAVQIVRWVAGEDAIWLRVVQDSASWIMGPDGLQAPTNELQVSYAFGTGPLPLRARPAWATNLSGNTRATFSYHEDTSICLDFSHSTLAADGTNDSLLYYDIVAYLADAETSPGVYAPGTEAGFPYTGTFNLARGKDHGYAVTQTGGAASIQGLLTDELPGEWQDATGGFTFDLTTGNYLENKLQGILRGGSLLQLEVPADVTMGIRGARFVGSGVPAGYFSGGFEADAPGSFRTATLEWTGDNLVTQDAHFTVELDLTLPADTPAGDLMLNWNWNLVHSNFNGPVYFSGNYTGPCTGTISLPWETQVVAHLQSGPMLPHLTRNDGPFESRVLLANPSAETDTISLHCHTEAGTWLESVSAQLHAGETLSLALGETLDADTAYIRLSAESAITASVVYTAKGDQKGPAQVPATVGNSKRLRLYAGNQDRTYDGLAMVNVSGTVSDVTITQYDANGGVHAVKQVATLQPGAKELYVLNGNFEALDGAAYEVTATQPLAMVAVRGDQQSQYLWQVQATALD